MKKLVIVVLLLSIQTIGGIALAAPGDLLFKLTAPDPQPGAGFGQVISIVDGDILVGEPGRRFDTGINARGRAYLFDGHNGHLKLAFDNPQPEDFDLFGEALAGGDGRVFIHSDGLVERVYAYSTDTGDVVHTFYEPDGPGIGIFGNALAYGSGSLLVANPSYSHPFSTVGRAYLFDAVTGQLQHILPNPEPKAGDDFGAGSSLAVFPNRAVVGAKADDLPNDVRPDGDNPGRVWLFDGPSGAPLFVLDNPNPDRPPPAFLSDSFGNTVAANEHVIVVGAQLDDTSGPRESGTVYVFDSKTGALRHTLFNPHPETNSQFGRSLAVTPAGNILAGATNSVDGIFGAGNAYLFDGATGDLLLEISNPDRTRSAAFGWTVGVIDESRFVIGDFIGNVYVVEAIPEPSAIALSIAGIFVALLAGRRSTQLRRYTY